MTDNERFQEAKALAEKYIDEQTSIGVLSEKMLHSTLKFYLCRDKSCHERKFKGFVTDVMIDGKEKPQVIEIQTHQAYRLKRKLEAYGDDAHVTVVLPVFCEKNVIWKDHLSGEMLPPHKTSRPKTVYNALAELYGIREHVFSGRIRVMVLLLSGTEYKLLDGRGKDRKKDATKLDTVPDAIEKTYFFEEKSDYEKLFPEMINNVFTVKDFSKAIHLTEADARKVLLLFAKLGIAAECGNEGRKKLWRRNM